MAPTDAMSARPTSEAYRSVTDESRGARGERTVTLDTALGDVSGSTPVFGDVEYVLEESVTTNGQTTVDTVGGLAGSLYARTGDWFGLERPP